MKFDALPGEVDRIKEMQRLVAGCNVGEAQTMAERAKLLRGLLQVQKVAAAMVREALRLECLAIRRIGEIDVSVIPENDPEMRNTAVLFASMSTAEMNRAIDAHPSIRTPIGLKRALAADRHDREMAAMEMAARRGQPTAPIHNPSDPLPEGYRRMLGQEIAADVARELLESLVCTDEPFGVGEAAEKLLALLGCEATDPLHQMAAKDLVRAAIHELNDDDTPAIITYLEDQVGWVRVPFAYATYAQGEAFIGARRKALADYQTKHDRLEEWWSEVQTVAADLPATIRPSSRLVDIQYQQEAS